jgi:transposase-like protein
MDIVEKSTIHCPLCERDQLKRESSSRYGQYVTYICSWCGLTWQTLIGPDTPCEMELMDWCSHLSED